MPNNNTNSTPIVSFKQYDIVTPKRKLMPLIFEICRESMVSTSNCYICLSNLLYQSIEIERAQAKDLRSQGYSDRQLTEMGLSKLAIWPPSVAMQK